MYFFYLRALKFVEPKSSKGKKISKKQKVQTQDQPDKTFDHNISVIPGQDGEPSVKTGKGQGKSKGKQRALRPRKSETITNNHPVDTDEKSSKNGKGKKRKSEVPNTTELETSKASEEKGIFFLRLDYFEEICLKTYTFFRFYHNWLFFLSKQNIYRVSIHL